MSRRKFCQWRGPRPVITAGDTQFRLPVFTHDNDGFASVHRRQVLAGSALLRGSRKGAPARTAVPAQWDTPVAAWCSSVEGRRPDAW